MTLILIVSRDAQKNLRAAMAGFCMSVCGVLGQMNVFGTYIQVLFLFAQSLVFELLHVSATYYNHHQGAIIL